MNKQRAEALARLQKARDKRLYESRNCVIVRIIDIEFTELLAIAAEMQSELISDNEYIKELEDSLEHCQ